MSINHSRLDRFLSSELTVSRKALRPLLARGAVQVDGVVAKDVGQIIHYFSHVVVDDKVLQNNRPRYLMLHKSVGVVSATKDSEHPTVMGLIDGRIDDLHIAGRLDRNTSGMLLLTNDSRWSSRLSSPESLVGKRYRVTLQNPVTPDYIAAFARGMYFDFEQLTTRPAHLKILSPFVTEVTLYEGRYHQIKRMFGRFRNPVLALHRMAVGSLELCPSLSPGEYRELTTDEIDATLSETK